MLKRDRRTNDLFFRQLLIFDRIYNVHEKEQ